MSNLRAHAERELELAGYRADDQEEGPNKWMRANVLELIAAFAAQGHSGSSAPFCVRLFADLAMFKPLGPLTGSDDEWNEVTAGTWQNRRCSHVFKDANGAYDINGKVFRCPSGNCYTSRDSRVPVKFPYMPKTEYVDVAE